MRRRADFVDFVDWMLVIWADGTVGNDKSAPSASPLEMVAVSGYSQWKAISSLSIPLPETKIRQSCTRWTRRWTRRRRRTACNRFATTGRKEAQTEQKSNNNRRMEFPRSNKESNQLEFDLTWISVSIVVFISASFHYQIGDFSHFSFFLCVYFKRKDQPTFCWFKLFDLQVKPMKFLFNQIFDREWIIYMSCKSRRYGPLVSCTALYAQ